MSEVAWLRTPAGLAKAYAGFEWELAYQYHQHSVVYRLSRAGEPSLFLKLAPHDHYPSLTAEADRMRWAGTYLPVPDVIGGGVEAEVAWLATAPLSGRDGTHPDQLANPEELTRTLARGLRRFHEAAPVHDCPFDFRLGAAMRHVATRVLSGQVQQRDFHPEFEHLTPREALELLQVTRPRSEDLVVCHGDYCPPNILIDGHEAVAYVDLGELGVADRWWDLAAATWSLSWNLGPGFEDLFLGEYGAALDFERCQFYRLMYDLAC